MFHYRLAATNNRFRMFIAVLLAIVVHMGFMNFEFATKSISVPNISIPRSVSIFLRQNNKIQIPNKPVEKTQNIQPIREEHSEALEKPEEPVFREEPAIIKEPESLYQPQAKLKETVKQPAQIAEEIIKPVVEDIVPVLQEPENVTSVLKPEADKVEKIPKITTQTATQTAQEKDEVILPGTLQLAYPRYQLNAPPAYPGLARKRGQEGTVVLQVLISRAGRVDDLKIDVSSNFSLLDRAAASAVRKWKFEPGKQGEEKIPMWVRVPITFKLK